MSTVSVACAKTAQQECMDMVLLTNRPSARREVCKTAD